MPTLRTYRLFISHAWSYGDDYRRLVTLLNAASNFDWRNYSVPENDPLHGGSASQLRQALSNQMALAGAILVVSGVYATHSEWMNVELELAASKGKPIIGLIPFGNQRTAKAVQDRAIEMVGWSTVSIVDAVRRLHL